MRKEKDLKRPTFKLVELDIFKNYDLPNNDSRSNLCKALSAIL